jgi:hypothetical protein
MRNRFRHAVPVAIVGIIALCFLAGCEECPDFEPDQQQPGECALTGFVLDAMSGDGVAGAEVYIVGDGSTETDESGWFLIADAPCGDQTVEITADGYIYYETEISLSDTTEQDFAIVPESEFDDWRFILTWGQDPADLDSHLWVPTGVETYMPVDYIHDGYLDQPPYAQLDIDDTSSYGPETITIRKHPIETRTEDFYAGEYIYAVHHWSGDSNIPNSGAQVRIYRGNVLVRTLNAPQGEAYDDWYWYVGRLNCRTGAWTLVNEYSEYPPQDWSRVDEK